MNRRSFISSLALGTTGLAISGGLSSCMGTYKPNIINAAWDEKFVFDSPDKFQIIQQILRCGLMAPSPYNTQPWLFRITDDRIVLLPDMKRRLHIADPGNRELFISQGTCIENMSIASSRFSVDMSNVLIDKEDVSIDFNFKSNFPNADKSLFKSMLKRQTNRRLYEQKELDSSKIKPLIDESGHMFGIKWINQKNEIDLLIDYVKESNRLLFGNPKYLDELKKWTRFSDSEAEEKLDGLYLRAMNKATTARWLGEIGYNLNITAETESRKEVKKIRSASGFMLFFSDDKRETLIETGRQIERTSVKITDMGLSCDYNNQPCRAVAVRNSFASDFGFKGLVPQAVLRIGYSEPSIRSPRRKIKDLIIS